MEGAMRTSAFEAAGEKKTGGKETRKIESLGWITESSVMPRKRRDIDGVGAASILDLQAELYRTQEDVKKIKEGGDLDPHRARKKLGILDVFSKKNSGVEERAGRDKLHLKTENDGSASYAALEKKAELYDKLVRGEVSDGDEKYNVLFYKKGTLEAEFEELESERRGETPNPNSGFQDTSTAAPSLRHELGNSTIGLSQEQKQLIKEVNQETIQERQKASTLKQKREEAAAKKREHLRNAYIKKKLEKMKATSCKATTLEPTGDERMPVILPDQASVNSWLNDALQESSPHKLTQPYEAADLVWYPITPAMGKPAFDSPDCVKVVKPKIASDSRVTKLFGKKNPGTDSFVEHEDIALHSADDGLKYQMMRLLARLQKILKKIL